MCGVDQPLRDLTLNSRYADIEACPQKKGIVGKKQVDRGIDFRRGRQRDLLPGSGKFNGADKAGRPGGGE